MNQQSGNQKTRADISKKANRPETPSKTENQADEREWQKETDETEQTDQFPPDLQMNSRPDLKNNNSNVNRI